MKPQNQTSQAAASSTARRIRSAAVAAMRGVLEAFESRERERALKRLGAVAARLVGPEQQEPALVEAVERGHSVGCDSPDGPDAHAPAVRAVDGAILAVAMARRLVEGREALLRVATAALALELSADGSPDEAGGRAHRQASGGLDEETINQIWDDSGLDHSPGSDFGTGEKNGGEHSADAFGGDAGAAMGLEDVRRPASIAMSTLFGAAIDGASLRRAVTAFEAAWLLEKESLGWPHHRDFRPSVEAIVVATARRWVDLRRGSEFRGPKTPQEAVEALFERVDVVAERVALDVLLSTICFLARGLEVELADGRRGVVVEAGEGVDDYMRPVVALDVDGEPRAREGRPGVSPGFPPVTDVFGFESMPSNSLSYEEPRRQAGDAVGDSLDDSWGVERSSRKETRVHGDPYSTQPYAEDDTEVPANLEEWPDEGDLKFSGRDSRANSRGPGPSQDQTQLADDYLMPELEDFEIEETSGPEMPEADSETVCTDPSPTQQFDDGELGSLVDACTEADEAEMSSGIETEANTRPVPDEQAWELMSQLVDEIDEDGLFPEDSSS